MRLSALSSIGLTKSEIKVYEALLKLGQSTAGPIVDESKVTRSKIYDILERLKHKGLVSSITKSSTKYFHAADPTAILDYIDEKKKSLDESKEAVSNILPYLDHLKESSSDKRVAEVFLGIKGMRHAFLEMIKIFSSKESYYAFGAGKGEDKFQVQKFFTELHKARMKKKVKSFIIFNEVSRGLFKNQEKSSLVKARYIEQSTPSAINIYKNITIIAILQKEPITILIRNQETADSFRDYFQIMWSMAQE